MGDPPNGVLEKTAIVPTISGFDYAWRIHEELTRLCAGVDPSYRPAFIDSVLNPHPDGEQYIKLLDPVRGRYAYIVACVQTPFTHPRRTINDNIAELEVAIDAVRRASAKHVTVVLPYFPYARQDRRTYRRRVPISAKVFARKLETARIHDLLTMDLHAEQIEGFFDIPMDILSPNTLFARYIKEHFSKALQQKMLATWAPDGNGLQRAVNLAVQLGASLGGICAKSRDPAGNIEKHFFLGNPEGKDVIVPDDIYASGGTTRKVAEALHAHGARSIVFAITHNLCIGPGAENLRKMYEEYGACMITTDSIQQVGKGAFVQRLEGVVKLHGKDTRTLFEPTDERNFKWVVQLSAIPLFAEAIHLHAAEASMGGCIDGSPD